jgi:hypothetical protein
MCTSTRAVTCGVTGGLDPAGPVTRNAAPSTAAAVVRNVPSGAGTTVPTASQAPSGAERSSVSAAVPARARPESATGSPASTVPAPASSVAATTSRCPLMNACSVQTKG